MALASTIIAVPVSAKPDATQLQSPEDTSAYMAYLTKYIVEHPNTNIAKRNYFTDPYAAEHYAKEMNALEAKLTEWTTEHPNRKKRDLTSDKRDYFTNEYAAEEHAKEMNALGAKLTEWTTEHPDGKRKRDSETSGADRA